MPGASRASHNVDVVVSGARSRVHDRVRVGASVGGSADPIDEHLDSGIDPFEGGDQERHLIEARLSRARMIARETAARRRRHVRQTLIGLGVIALVLYVMGGVPLGLVLLPVLGLGGLWLAEQKLIARPAAARGTSRTASRRAASGSARATGRKGTSARSTSTRGAAGSRTGSRTARRHIEKGRTVPARAAADDEFSDVRLLSDDEVAARRASEDPDGWEAVEAPLPRYIAQAGSVRRRRAGGSIRGEDWTAQRMLEQVEALRMPGVDTEAELGLDEYVNVPVEETYEHRRAVND